ncbi:MAG TPA: hypothetical protein VF791_05295 [Pyrinomonadaceae bacterium]
MANLPDATLLGNLWIRGPATCVASTISSKVADYTRQKEKGKRQKASRQLPFYLFPFAFSFS